MSYSVTIPLSGYAGWAFLKRTEEKQQALLAKAPMQTRDEEQFRAKIATVKTAEELMADRKMLRVALGAFGLSDDVNNTYFIRKVLESNTGDSSSLAGKLSDKRYKELAEAFGFGSADGPKTATSGFADRIITASRQRNFEEAVGDVDNSMRIALNAERELPGLAGEGLSERGKWYTVLGSAPLRELFETALGLPSSFGTINIDQQVNLITKKARSVFGDSSVSQFADPQKLQSLVKKYIILAEVKNSGLSSMSRGSAALQLLQASQIR